MSKPKLSPTLILLLSLICYNYAAQIPSKESSGLVVTLNYGSFRGNATGDLVTFLGMPFAAPPTGNLRFEPPQPPIQFSGIRQASTYGAACPQIIIPAPTQFTLISEDCLFVNVIKPADIPAGKKLPIVFVMDVRRIGDTSANIGNPVVERSIALNEPIIYVSANYRICGLGFLGGKEVKDAGIGNAGLRDPHPIIFSTWGGSAGAISVGLQMLINDGNTEGLFHGAFMESGSPFPLRDITFYQSFYDSLVADTGCSGSGDTLACLRTVPLDKFMDAVNKSPNVFSFTSLALAWGPSIDGQFIVRDSQTSIQQGLYAKIPLITGDCDDEGTLFSFGNLNITTNQQFLDYVESKCPPLFLLEPEQLAAVGAAYPDNVLLGSPFDTGIFNALTPQFKRLAAFQGDLIFHAPRRFFLQYVSQTQPTFAYLYKRGKPTPFLGSSHGTDAPELYGSDVLPDFLGTDAVVNFVNTQNPTQPKNLISLLSLVDWPLWNSSADAPPLFTFVDPAPFVTMTPDTFRADAIKLLTNISLEIAGT